jgi:hypothetical protein
VSTEALLTVLGLLVAIVTLLPEERRLNLRLRIRALDVSVIVVAFLIVHYIKYFPVLNALGVPALGPWRWGFDPETASYLVLLATTGFISIRIHSASLRPSRIRTFQNLAETYLFAGRFPELLFLLESNLADLRRFIERRHLTTRFRAWLIPRTMVKLFNNPTVSIDARAPETSRLLKLLPNAWRTALAGLLPDYDEPTRQAERVFERIFLSVPFVKYLAAARPYFGLDVLRVNKAFFAERFLKMYMDALLSNTDSVLYEEIRQNQRIGPHDRYLIDPLNPLINFFFGEQFRANELKLYKPLGDAALEQLERLGLHRPSDQYRQPTRDYFDNGRWRCPLFASRCLFDFMVTEALHRGVHWHMWLMYFEAWTERIVQNMAALDRRDIDLSREWPTPYHYLLYEIIDTQRQWIQTSAEIDQSLPSVKVDKVDLEHGSIAKSATISLGACLRSVVESTNITPQFKGYLLDVVARGYGQLVELKRDTLARMYEMAIVRGGTSYRSLDGFYLGIAEALPHISHDSLYVPPSSDLIETMRGLAAQNPR